MKLQLATQTKVLAEREVDSITLPTTTGIIEILPGHENLITELEIGKMIVKATGTGEQSDAGKGEKEEFAINGGIVRIMHDEITILVNEAIPTAEIIAATVDKAIESAEKRQSKIEDPTELIQLEKRLRFEKFKKGMV